MGWMLVVSERDEFQREAVQRAGQTQCVGATGEQSACGLMGSIDIERVLVDARDDVGQRFLSALQHLPSRSLSDVEVLVVGPDREIPRFVRVPDIDSALARRRIGGTLPRRVKI